MMKLDMRDEYVDVNYEIIEEEDDMEFEEKQAENE